MTSPCRNTAFIGIDGATYDLLDPLIEQGLMPHLAALFARGSRSKLESTAHPLTPPAWTTLMTGMTPGNHGVYDFIRVDHDADPPSYTLANSSDVKSETIWSMASRQGCRVACLNFPMMFPAPKVDGNIIPGYVPWSYLGRAIHPRELYKKLKERSGFNAKELSTDWQQERQAVQGLSENNLEEWVDFHLIRERRWFDILKYLMEEDPTPLTAVLFDGSDRIQHLCYHLIDPATAADYDSPAALRARELSLQYFRELDDYVGYIVDKAGDDATIVVASDHGFTLAGNKIFYANTWLQQHGYLQWQADAPVNDSARVALDENTETGSMFDWDGTLAYAFSSSSNAIYIRQASGPGKPGVPADEYEAFRDKLIAELLDFRDPDTGEQVVVRAMTREQAFPGADVSHAPDITVELSDRGFLSVLRSETPLQQRDMPYGTHHPDGVFAAAGPGIRQGVEVDRFSITDITPLMLYALGLPIPEEMEGSVPTAIFEDGYLDANPPLTSRGDTQTDSTSDEQLPEEAEAQIRERLKALGYL